MSCPDCDGKGYVEDHAPRCDGTEKGCLDNLCPIERQCDSCGGLGEV